MNFYTNGTEIKQCIDKLSSQDINTLKSKLMDNILQLTKRLVDPLQNNDVGIILHNALMVNLFTRYIDTLTVSTNKDQLFGSWTVMLEMFDDILVVDAFFTNKDKLYMECVYDTSGKILFGPYESHKERPRTIGFLEAIGTIGYRF
jgi:hypothetical protein